MKRILVKVGVEEIQQSTFLDLYRVLKESGYDTLDIRVGEVNEIVVTLVGRACPDDEELYSIETGCILGYVRGFLQGTGHSIKFHSVKRIE